MRLLVIVLACTFSLLSSNSVLASESCAVTDYQKGQRPGIPGEPTKIRLGLTIVDVTSISDLDQTVSIDAVLNIRWQDPRLASATGCRFQMDQVWHPDIQLLNSGELASRRGLELVVGEQGWLEGSLRLRGAIANPRSMADFPFDEHTIVLDIMSLRYPSSEVEFEVEDQWTLRASNLTIPDWAIGDVSAQIDNVTLPQLGRVASTYRLSLPAQRLPRFYIYKIIMPLIMIVFMSWGVFWVNPQSLAPQLTLSGTSMLTLVTFQFTMNDLLPRIGYFTQLDKFILSSSVLVFLALVEAVSTGFIASRGGERTAQLLDRYSRIGFPTTFIVVVLVTLVW